MQAPRAPSAHADTSACCCFTVCACCVLCVLCVCWLQTAFSFLGRMRRQGGMDDLKDVLGRWKPWIPPKQDQAFQQVCVFFGGGGGVLSL